jgi:alpha-beta hydrolase superfamily lysophospholipase
MMTLPISYGQFVTPAGDHTLVTTHIEGLLSVAQGERARVLVFVPGLGGSIEFAQAFLAPLRPTFTAIMGVDLRQFGQNQSVKAFDLADTFVDLCAYIDTCLLPYLETLEKQTGGTPEVVLMGLSLGGLLATHLAHRYPALFSNVGLLVPAFAPSLQSFPLQWVVPNLLKLAVGNKHQTIQLPYGLEAITRNQALLSSQALKAHAPKVPLTLSLHFLSTIRHWQASGCNKAKQLPQPVWLCVAGQDKVTCSVTMQRVFKQLPSNQYHRLVRLPDAYHDVVIEPEASQLAEAFAKWVVSPQTAF